MYAILFNSLENTKVVLTEIAQLLIKKSSLKIFFDFLKLYILVKIKTLKYITFPCYFNITCTY